MWQRSWTVTIHTKGSLRPSCVRCRDCLARPCWNAWKVALLLIAVCDKEAPRLWQTMGRQLLDYVPLQEHLGQMLKDLIEEAAKVDLEPKPASLWWSIYASEEKEDVILGTSKCCFKFPCEDEFKILGCMKNRQGKTCGAVEERMQSANRAFGKTSKYTEVRTFRGE